MARTLQKAKGRKESGTFALLPHNVMDHPDFTSLSGSALKVLLWLLRQYNGRNNGNLSASIGQANAQGIGSSATLTKALAELQKKRLIVRTREGRFMNPGKRCALYAITWKAVNDCPGKELEQPPTLTPLRAFSLEKNRKPSSESEQGSVHKLKPLPAKPVIETAPSVQIVNA